MKLNWIVIIVFCIVDVGCKFINTGSCCLSLGHHELRLSVGPMLNRNHATMYTCMYLHNTEVCTRPIEMSAVFVQFLLFRWRHCASRPQTYTGREFSRPVKSRSYRRSGRADSIHRCCYECRQRSQFIEDNAEPAFLPGLNYPA